MSRRDRTGWCCQFSGGSTEELGGSASEPSQAFASCGRSCGTASSLLVHHKIRGPHRHTYRHLDGVVPDISLGDVVSSLGAGVDVLGFRDSHAERAAVLGVCSSMFLRSVIRYLVVPCNHATTYDLLPK